MKQNFLILILMILVLVINMVACSTSQEPSQDSINELTYLDFAQEWLTNCQQASQDTSNAITNNQSKTDIVSALYNEKSKCSSSGSYLQVPSAYEYVQSEIDNFRSDEGISIDYTIAFVQYRNQSDKSSAISYGDKAQVHLENVLIELKR